ncbi:T9SS type A sorting domain-containing protein [Formosa haliotis]|uniref:T9SS type A sorting domain-containing protein n=1 Tax=Formosa haliotis TaxID=1555194 RepID=UPI000825544C|nr:T9SS type A sorting domain-containing protein [Formosa haliotis]
MKKIYLLLLFCITFTFISYGQVTQTLYKQSFDGSNNNWLPNEPNPSFKTNSAIQWGVMDQLTVQADGNTYTLGSIDGNNFLALNAKTFNTPPNQNKVFTFWLQDVDISGHSGVEMTFTWEFSAQSETAKPTVNYEAYGDEDFDNPFAYTTESLIKDQSSTTGGSHIIVPDNKNYNSVSLFITIDYTNVTTSTDINKFMIGFDNFYITSTTNNYPGYVYTGTSWTKPSSYPNAPSEPDNTTGAHDALILSGNYEVNSNVILKNVYTEVGAGTTIKPTGSLTVNNIETINNLVIESTSMNYGSLVVNGTIEGNASYKRHVNIDGQNDLISAPVTGQTFGSFAAANPNLASADITNTTIKKFGPFSKSGNGESYDNWGTSSSAEGNRALAAAVGYRTASTDNGTFTFTGVVNTQNINAPVYHNLAQDYSQWNLIGNPYPSYLSVQDFLAANEKGEYNVGTENNPIYETRNKFFPGKYAVYGYDGDASDGWDIHNLTSDYLIAPGQGFYVGVGENYSGEMYFTRTMRRSTGGDDFIPQRANNYNKTHFKLSLSTIDKLRHTSEVYFLDDIVTLSLDEGYDATIFGNNSSGYTLFTQLVESNPTYKLGIQSLPNSSLNEEGVKVALGVIAPQGQQLIIDIKETTLTDDVLVYLEDTKNNTWTLLNEKAYTFTTDSRLTGTGRFYIHVSKDDRLSLDKENQLENLKFITGNQSIKIKGLLEKDSKITIFDIQGRSLTNRILNNTVNEFTVNTANYSSGIYIVKIENVKGNNLSKRVILK